MPNQEIKTCQNCKTNFTVEPDDFSAEGGSASGGDFYLPSYKTTEERSKKI